ncbi:hypothetical protein V2J09_006121 [Rumex salicifolius]
MFYLSQIEHKLRLPPHLLHHPLDVAIKSELESLFLDKIIPKLGLSVSIYDIADIQGGFVLASEGAPTYKVIFRLIVFRPFVGEVISAKIKESTKDGLQLTLGFFDDIYIPSSYLPDPSKCDADIDTVDGVTWYWDPSEGVEDKLYFYKDEEIRFCVVNVGFPPIPLEQEAGVKPFAPMVVTGSLIAQGGLGHVSWWS